MGAGSMMKSLKMSKVLSTIKRRNTSGLDVSSNPNDNSPEAVAVRSVKSFCESSGPNSAEDEVIYLPSIVEAAESSPTAAKQCADIIRDYLKKDYITRTDIQYNALMLVRILADNPGPTFTRNLDQDFVKTAKDLLRATRSERVRHMLMETLTSFETTKFYDEGLIPLIDMWKREKEKSLSQKGSHSALVQSYLHRQAQQPPPQAMHMTAAMPVDPHSQNYFARNHRRNQLPDAVELAGRLEEARTSAGLLQQVLTNTPPGEVIGNDLIKEFAERCQSASRSIQGYMAAEDPAPDNETMETLIDTNEQLQSALNLHQRSTLNARKHVESLATNDDNVSSPDEERVGATENGSRFSRHPSPPDTGLGLSISSGSGSKQPTAAPTRETNGKGKGREYEPVSFASSAAGPSRSRTPPAEDDPFRDPDEPANAAGGSSSRYHDQAPRLDYEPYHPGFGHSARQESAVGKEAMHGAIDNTSSSRANDVSSSSRPADVSDDESLYDVSRQKQTEPIYRY